MTTAPREPTRRGMDVFGAALLQAGSRDAGAVEIEAIVRARPSAFAVSVVRHGLVGLEAMVASAGRRLAAALRIVRHAAPAALLCLAFGASPAGAEQQDAAITLLALGDGAHGVLSVPMHVDTRGLPAVVVVHDLRGESSGADLYVENLLSLGIAVLEIEPFPQVTNGVAALPIVTELDAAALVTAAAEALALAEGKDPRAVGAVGFGAGARAVLLAGPGATGRAPLPARVLLYPGCETLRRPFFARILQNSLRPALGREGGAPSLPGAAPEGHVLLLHGARDAGNAQESCAALASDLAVAAEVHHVVVTEAGRGSDRVAPGAMVGPTALPAPDVGRGLSVAARVTDEAALAADTVSAFLAEALSAKPVRAAAR